VFRSVRSRLIASFALIVVITLAAAAIALFARIGGYREQLDASTLRTTAAPVYYNLTYFPDALRVEPASGRRLRTELTSYLKAQAQDTGVIVLLVDAQGNVIQDAISDEQLANAHFEDQVRGGEIAFDYRLRPGVVAHSNAIALMRAVGLEV